MNESRKIENVPTDWKYEGWRVDWRAVAWVATAGAITIAIALGGNWLFYKAQPADFSPKPVAQFPGPGLNVADDRAPQWRQVRTLSLADSQRISDAMKRLVEKGDAAWDSQPGEAP